MCLSQLKTAGVRALPLTKTSSAGWRPLSPCYLSAYSLGASKACQEGQLEKQYFLRKKLTWEKTVNLTVHSSVPCIITCHGSTVFKQFQQNSASLIPVILPVSNVFPCSRYCFIEFSLVKDDSGKLRNNCLEFASTTCLKSLQHLSLLNTTLSLIAIIFLFWSSSCPYSEI